MKYIKTCAMYFHPTCKYMRLEPKSGHLKLALYKTKLEVGMK
jgi:hypothetical protein